MKDLKLYLTADRFEDLYINPATGDVEITNSVAQAVIIRLRWFLGEWKINPTYGLPWYDEVFIKHPSVTLVESRVRDAIKSVTEVKAVNDLSVVPNYTKRKLSISFTITCTDGHRERGEVIIDG